MYCTQRSVESEHLFLAGKFFTFFFLDRVGELAAAAAEEKVFGSFYIFFFWRGRFGTAAAADEAAATYLALSLSLSLSRAGEFGRGKMEERKERRERQYKVYFPPISFSASEREKKREEKGERTCGEVGRKSIGFFCIYIFIYYIYHLVVSSCCVDREETEERREKRGNGSREGEERKRKRKKTRQGNKKNQYIR